jgi:hypothetical protein
MSTEIIDNHENRIWNWLTMIEIFAKYAFTMYDVQKNAWQFEKNL